MYSISWGLGFPDPDASDLNDNLNISQTFSNIQSPSVVKENVNFTYQISLPANDTIEKSRFDTFRYRQ